jgi:Fe-S-cluster containining protein
VADGARGEQGDLPAGAFSDWLGAMRAALRGEQEADVPCGTCTACCASSQFVHIAPDERDALAHIPPALLFPAPLLPAGHVLLGYDEHGRCPMLTDAGCSIYEHRPRTCRTYDCRVFPAAGVEVDDGKELIGRRARRWRFDHPTDGDRREHEAVRAAAAFVAEHEEELGAGPVRANPTRHAVLAVEAARAFLGTEPGSGRAGAVPPGVAEVQVALRRHPPAR